MTVSLIAAVSNNWVIGKDNDLPWHLPADMKFFMETTKGHTIITGRKNYFTIPEKYRPLSDRINIIVTRQPDFHEEGCLVAHSMNQALEKAGEANEIFVIGGGEIYTQALPLADKLYITWVDADIKGDTYFPRFNEADWKVISEFTHAQDEKHLYPFTCKVYEKSGAE